MQEAWKPVVGFEGIYEVSNFGKVQSLDRMVRHVSKSGRVGERLFPGRVLKLVDHTHGYKSAVLCDSPKRSALLIHRVVAEAFIPNPDNLPWINHKDANKSNNRVDNLEWCTPSDNMQHAMKLGLHPVLRGSQRGTAKLNEESVAAIKKLLTLGFSNEEIANLFKVSTAPISYIRTGKAWNHVPW